MWPALGEWFTSRGLDPVQRARVIYHQVHQCTKIKRLSILLCEDRKTKHTSRKNKYTSIPGILVYNDFLCAVGAQGVVSLAGARCLSPSVLLYEEKMCVSYWYAKIR